MMQVSYMAKYIVGPKWDERIIRINQRGKVGIIMSGGIDSYVLYHLLKDPIIFNIKRADGFDTADRVRRLTGQEVIEIEEVSTEHDKRVWYTSNKIIEDYDLDQLYNGSNMIPPIQFFPEFAEGYASRPWEEHEVIMPFRMIYKYHVISLANNLGIDLSDTMSCISRIDNPCGKCWHCRERAWGFKHAT